MDITRHPHQSVSHLLIDITRHPHQSVFHLLKGHHTTSSPECLPFTERTLRDDLLELELFMLSHMGQIYENEHFWIDYTLSWTLQCTVICRERASVTYTAVAE